LNNIELANSALKDVQAQKRTNAAKKIQLLLDNDADLGENWGGVTRLALSIGEFSNAEKCSLKFLSIAPKETKRIIQCAAILAECGKIERAIELVKPLINKDTTPDILHFLGTTYSQIGEIELAKKYLNELLKLAPKSAISWLTLAAIHKFSSDDDLYTNILSIQSHMKSDNRTHTAPYWFALGKVFMDTKQADKAFSSFMHGCNLMNNDKSYNASAHANFVDEIIAKQNKAFFEKFPELEGNDNNPPIFIIGLPRSGTTLLQQLLSSHPDIGLGGEVKCLSYATTEIGQANINSLADASHEESLSTLEKIQTDYYHLLAQQFDKNKPVVDKTLSLNSHVGLITKAFPRAGIIRITRNVEDNAWSCFRTFFNQGIGWSYDLKNIATFFHHEQRLTKHWQSTFGDHILEITYEDLINNTKETLNKCLNHIGKEFNENMLTFYKQKLPVQTASVGQVRKPINNGSVNLSVQVTKQLTPFSDEFSKLNAL
jgi:tetratricopeptide (TPR) repeat protein